MTSKCNGNVGRSVRLEVDSYITFGGYTCHAELSPEISNFRSLFLNHTPVYPPFVYLLNRNTIGGNVIRGKIVIISLGEILVKHHG
jgi:hypothetical protein